jgi:hypothetical protein
MNNFSSVKDSGLQNFLSQSAFYVLYVLYLCSMYMAIIKRFFRTPQYRQLHLAPIKFNFLEQK